MLEDTMYINIESTQEYYVVKLEGLGVYRGWRLPNLGGAGKIRAGEGV